jgi:hypothetical protein
MGMERCALRTDDPSDRLWVQHPRLDTRPDAATARGANGGVEFFPGFSARELRVDQGRICGVSAQGEGDAKLDVEAKLRIPMISPGCTDFDLAQDSEMISPTIPIFMSPGARGVLAVWFLASGKPRGQS